MNIQTARFAEHIIKAGRAPRICEAAYRQVARTHEPLADPCEDHLAMHSELRDAVVASLNRTITKTKSDWGTVDLSCVADEIITNATRKMLDGRRRKIGTDKQFVGPSVTAAPLSELQVFTKGDAVDRGLIRPGHYGISENDEKVTDLGESINLVALARRPKAIDMTDANAVVTHYDPETEEFKQIAARSLEINSHCVYGPSFLVYEQGTKRFLEFFCGTKATRSKAKEIYPFLPMTEDDIARQKSVGNAVSSIEPHGPLPLTLTSQVVEKGKYTWHIPVVTKCLMPFPMPTQEQIDTEVRAFISCNADSVETVKKSTKKKASI
jgi:hypothetical protein